MTCFRDRRNVTARLAPFVLAALTTAGLCGSVNAGAWTLPKGKGQVILSARASEAEEGFDAKGRRGTSPRFSKAEAAIYGEYGLTDAVTMIVEGTASSSAIGAPLSFDEARWGLGALGGRFRLWEGGGSVVSMELAGRLSPSDFDRAAPQPVKAEGEVRLLAGHGFAVADWPAFADAALGYRFGVPLEASAFEDRDELRVDLTLGLRPLPDWLLLVQSYNAIEIGGEGVEPTRRSHKLEASFVHDLTPALSLQLGLFTTVAGANALREQGLVGAVWMRF